MPVADHPIDSLPTPDPAYGPTEAVTVQLTALADNDDPVPNAGIKTAYNFASFANRRATGPLDRFIGMVEGPQYAPMIDHVAAEREPLARDGDRATQRVRVTGPDGREMRYEFGLSVESAGPFANCWLTDRVTVV